MKKKPVCPTCGAKVKNYPTPSLHAFSIIFECGRHEIYGIGTENYEPYIETKCGKPIKEA